jgi:hypothetical protein
MSTKKCHGFFITLALAGAAAVAAGLVKKYGCCCEGECAAPDAVQPEEAAPEDTTEPTESTPAATETSDTGEADTEETPKRARYGKDSFTGDDPPEGFTIKGNERSMKYHTPDSASYERTNADVWFSSPEVAERAGFTRAQR